MVMISLENSMSEEVVIGDVDTFFVSEDACLVLPVREVRVKGR